MKKITEKELENVTGGEITVWGCIAVGTIIIFIAGIIKGYTYPSPCK